ncbi:MAG: rRNA pseudouridine synthase [Planctomycetes bacterium]|nr:rRNA pseudouridine synthase [Planctomycetota bacterium]
MSDSPIFMFHKPRGVVVTRSDERGRRTVYDVLPAWVRGDGWKPVGRLDLDSRGLLLFVQDGKLQEQLARPGAHGKVYEVWVRGAVSAAQLKQLKQGVKTAQGTMRAADIDPRGGTGGKSRLLVTLNEGKNRQIRRMFGALKDTQTGKPLKVLEIKRLSFGPLKLDVPSGQWRWLSEAECAALNHP